jgi:hypothetical protein
MRSRATIRLGAGLFGALTGLALLAAGCSDSLCEPVVDLHLQGRITVPATNLPASDVGPSCMTITGAGSRRVGTIAIDSGTGWVDLDGQHVAAVTYRDSAFENSDETMFQTLAAASDRLWLVWFYCRGATLRRLYREGTDGEPAGFEDASGACALGEGCSAVALPSLDMPYPILSPAIRMHGPSSDYDGVNPGSAVLGGRSMVLLPFASVDCSDCGNPGWQEMHALFWDQAAPQLCIGILYFFGPGHATMQGVLCLPSWFDPTGGFVTFDGTWQTCE